MRLGDGTDMARFPESLSCMESPGLPRATLVRNWPSYADSHFVGKIRYEIRDDREEPAHGRVTIAITCAPSVLIFRAVNNANADNSFRIMVLVPQSCRK